MGASVTLPDGSSIAFPDGMADSDIASAVQSHLSSTGDSLLPAAPYGATDAAVHGMTLGLSDAGRAATTAATRYLTGDTPGFDYAQAAREIQRGRDAYANQPGSGSLAANLAGGLAGAPALASKAIMAAPGLVARTAASAGTGAAIGGVQGAADNNTSLAAAGSGALNGAELGAAVGATPPIAGAAGRALVPGLSPAAQTLRAAGVEPTPGAATGGLLGAIEGLISRVPVLGAPINSGRQAAIDQLGAATSRNAQSFNRGAINDALSHIGESLEPNTAIGNDAIAEMAQKVKGAYNAAVPNAGGALDTQAVSDINGAVANAKLTLPADRASQFENFVQNNILGRVQQPPTTATGWQEQAQQLANGQAAPYGTLPGQAFKDAESDLGREASTYLSGNSTADERKLGMSYQQLQGTLRDWLARVNPDSATAIQAANQSYAKMLRVQDAGARSPDGVFTPSNLLASAKKYGGIPQYAQGGALMQDYAQNGLLQNQDLASAAKNLLASPSGAGGHGIGMGVAGGMIGTDVLEHLLSHPSPIALSAIAAPYLAMSGAYSNAGRRAANGLLSLPPPAGSPLTPMATGLLAPQDGRY